VFIVETATQQKRDSTVRFLSAFPSVIAPPLRRFGRRDQAQRPGVEAAS